MTPFEIRLGEALLYTISAGKITKENLETLYWYREMYKEAMMVKKAPMPPKLASHSITLSELEEMVEFAKEHGQGECKTIVVEPRDEVILTSWNVFTYPDRSNEKNICDMGCV